MRRLLAHAAVFAVLLGFVPCAGCAQPADAPQQALRSGAYDDARRLFKAQLDAPTDSTYDAALAGYFETFLATGEYEAGLREAGAILQRQRPPDPTVLYLKGRLLVALGRYDEAEAAFRDAAERREDYWQNALAAADLFEATGRRREARQIYGAIYQRHQGGHFRTAETLAVAARAAAALQEFHAANAAFRTAHELDPQDAQILYAWAELFRQKYNDADAQQTYEDALAVNPRSADVFVGMARSAQGFGQKEALARQALGINPNHVGALGILASLRILDGHYEEADAFLDQALAVNPNAVEALAHRAAIHHLRGEEARAEAVAEQALAINETAGDFFVTLSEDLALRFRYPAAAAAARRAAAVDPESASAHAAAGLALLRLGETQQARRHLERSFDQDPFNLFVGNTLTLLDEYQDFALLEGPNIRLLIHNDERDVLGPAMLEEAEAAFAALSERYPYTPAGKILVEAYNDRDDFAVRVAGVPHLGLLGVCFGDVLALNTPRAQAGREYNWARTLWHEMAHTMAIGASAHHVPRWFTEGLSVYEEQRARPAWGRELDLELFSALDEGKLLPLREIDRGFTRPQFPGQILLSYYHASKIIGFIEARHGFEAIANILETLGQGESIAEAIQQTTGQNLDALDADFRDELRQQRARFDDVLTDMPSLLEDDEAEDPARLDALTDGSANPFLQRLRQGRDALAADELSTAETRFREALTFYPKYTGPGNAYDGLAAVYRARGETEKLRAILEDFLAISEYGAAEARELADLYAARGDTEKAIAYLERALHVDPYDLPTHDLLATFYAQQGVPARAVRARRAILALEPVDRAQAFYALARALYDADEPAPAKRAVLQSLELAPGFRDAQKLLLTIANGQ